MKERRKKKENYKDWPLISLVPDRDSVRGKRNKKLYIAFSRPGRSRRRCRTVSDDEMIFCILRI